MARRQNLIIGIIIFISVLFFIFAMSMFISSIGTRSSSYELTSSGSKIAVVEIIGIIYDAEQFVRQLERYSRDSSIKAIVIRLESPGGGVAASQEIYYKVKKVRDSGKVVIASMGAVAASGAYYIACGADTIMANPGTTTGSIGVIAEIPNTKGLLDKIGVKFEIIKSGKFKDAGSPYKTMSDVERQYLQDFVDDAFKQFVDDVARERNIQVHRLLKLADGRIFTGQKALDHGLIDLLGSYEDAIDLAATLGGIEGKPKIVRERKQKLTLFDLFFQDLDEVFNAIQSWPRIKYQVIF
ncbi:signal peptide peptidase SppA [candidate division KSB1 bacterium]|nr:signal peptide peptidase SppA [candidate division KSB1 bacterium]